MHVVDEDVWGAGLGAWLQLICDGGKHTMDIVLKDCRFVDGWKVSDRGQRVAGR